MKHMFAPIYCERWPALDAVRGYAMIGMVAYHIVWNLGYFEFVPRSVLRSVQFHAFGHAVAAAFVALAGIGLTLAARDGLRLARALRRIGTIGLAAAAVSVVTYLSHPESFIFFGILHLLALSSLVSLPFLFVPAALVLLVAAIALLLPLADFAPVFDEPILLWLGLGEVMPRTNDWRPFLPWFGVMLAGMLLGRAILARGLPFGMETWQPRNAASKLLAFSGRHTLLIYLVHQPILFPLFFAVATLMDP